MNRPTHRGGCSVNGVCPFVSCRYHLFMDVSEVGSLLSQGRSAFTRIPKRNDFDEWSDGLVKAMVEAEHTCSLDVADDGGSNLEETAKFFGVSRQGIQFIEKRALAKLAKLATPEMLEALQDAMQRGPVDDSPNFSDLPTVPEMKAGIAKLEEHRRVFFEGQGKEISNEA